MVIKIVKRILSNATILTGDDLEITRGYIIIKGKTISEVSEGSPPTRGENLKGGFVIPPFVNAHTHVMDSIAKDLYIGRTQEQVVGPGGVKFRSLESSSRKRILTATKATLLDMIQTGTLAHCDFREGAVQGINMIKKISPPQLKSIILGRSKKSKDIHEILKASDGIGLPRVDAFSQEEMKKISQQTLRANKLFAVHVAETEDDQIRSMKKFGMSETLQGISLRSSFVVHGTHSGADDFSKLRKNNIPVVFCPRSNCLLSVGVPPMKIALESGVDFLFGTDNAMVCQPNMFEELSFAWTCLRRDKASYGSADAREILKAATIKPLTFFNLPWGGIKEGERATFMVLAKRNNLTNLSDVFAGLLNRARADNIRAIYQGGKIIYKLKH